MAVNVSGARRLYQTIGAVRTGIIILIIVGITSAAGTVILQRPLTDVEELERAYSPQTLRVLDAVGLMDVYHAWWYLVLLALLAASIICASLERWPNAWRYYSRPYRRTDRSFRAVLPLQRSFAIGNEAEAGAQALETTEKVWKKNGLKPERIVEHDEVSLYAERSRYAVLAVYVVHASLLLIMLGGIVDGLFGYKGYLSLVPGRPALAEIELHDGTVRKLPFAIRCDDAGQENYTGQYAMMPKRWWSTLTVVQKDNGREITRKQIAVNDPLVYHGVRFYQSGYGLSGDLRRAKVALVARGANQKQLFSLALDQASSLDDGSALKLVKFFPDAYAMDGGIYQKSKELGNAAAQMRLTGKSGNVTDFWLFRADESQGGDLTLVGPFDAQGAEVATIPYRIVATAEMAPFTGLQVSHEPGQWAVWAGCLLMGAGLVLAFWVLHQRYWAVVTTNKEGQPVLWMGAAANKNREVFEVRFRELAEAVEQQLVRSTQYSVLSERPEGTVVSTQY